MEIRKPDVVRTSNSIEFNLDRETDLDSVRFASDETRQDAPSLLHRHDDRNVWSGERWRHRTPDPRPAVDRSASAAVDPFQGGRRARGTKKRRSMCGRAALETPLEPKDAFSTTLPIGLGEWSGNRKRDVAGLGCEQVHGRPFPRRRTSVNRAPEPPPVHIAISAFGTCAVMHSPRICWTPRTTRWNN